MKNFKDGSARKIQNKVRQYIYRSLQIKIPLSTLQKLGSHTLSHNYHGSLLLHDYNDYDRDEEQEDDPATFIKKNAKTVLHMYK